MVTERWSQTFCMNRVIDKGIGMKVLALCGIFALISGSGCAGKELDVGGDSSNGAAAGGATSQVAGAPAALTCDPSQSPFQAPECRPGKSPLVGKWKGNFPGTNDEAVLEVSGLTPDGKPCGSFSIGNHAPLAPATDATAAYPPLASPGSAGGPSYGLSATDPYPGHAYPLFDVLSTDSRLVFGVPLPEVWRSWCALQAPIPNQLGCVKRAGGTHATATQCFDGDGQEISCAQYHLCITNDVCACNSQCCDARPDSSGLIVDLHRDGKGWEGSVNAQPFFLDPAGS